jgi:hypothetical protein
LAKKVVALLKQESSSGSSASSLVSRIDAEKVVVASVIDIKEGDFNM